MVESEEKCSTSVYSR